MVMISLSASPACGPRFLAGWASWFSSRACQCGLKAWQKSSNWQKSSTSRSNIDASPPLMVPTQEEECRGDKGLASPQTRNSGSRRYLLGGGTVLCLAQPLPAVEHHLRALEGAPRRLCCDRVHLHPRSAHEAPRRRGAERLTSTNRLSKTSIFPLSSCSFPP